MVSYSDQDHLRYLHIWLQTKRILLWFSNTHT